ncbi:MAG: hypothetical protein WBD63_10865 [Phycisphaerae bacterium]|nr:hypothetical protein [Phycisphaerae bacterium]
MLGKRDIRDSMGYVTLGLFAHALLDELLDARTARKSRPAHSDMIELAIESLSALENPRRTSPSRVPDLVFQTYQEVSTLRRLLQAKKVPSVSDPGSLKALLCTVVDKGKGIPKPRRAKAIDQSMTFFAELAKQAIINAESPEEKIPSGVRQIATKLAIT